MTGGGLRGEAREVLRNRDAAEILVAEKGLERDRRRDLAGLDEGRRDLVDAPVQILEEVRGLEEVRDPVIGVVVDQNRTEQGLLGIDVVRRYPILRLRGLQAGNQGIGSHRALRRSNRLSNAIHKRRTVNQLAPPTVRPRNPRFPHGDGASP
jgi:hypothetical protein